MSYFVMNDRPCLYVDIDFTICAPFKMGDKTIVEGLTAEPIAGLTGFYALLHNIDTVKTFHARGHSIVFWSAGGANWGRTVVEALGLGYLATAVLNKPNWWIDDKPAESFMNGPDQRIVAERVIYRST